MTKKSVNENMENKIDRLFKNDYDHTVSRKESLSPIRKSPWSKIAKGSRNPFAKTVTPKKER